MDDFRTLTARTRPADWAAPPIVLALDPGDTMGWSVFTHGELTDCGQLPGVRANIGRLMILHLPSVVVCEEYRIYGGKALEHVGSTIPTLRLIGALEMLCDQQEIPLVFQSARTAKGWITDAKLRSWRGYYKQGAGHAMDSVRHGCYFLLFGTLDNNGVAL